MVTLTRARIECAGCEGTGRFEPPDGDHPCPWCDGQGWTYAPTPLDRINHARRNLLAKYRETKLSWSPDARPAAMIRVHRPVLADNPRLRAVIDADLMDKLAETYPLRWRYDDVRHHLANIGLALRGKPPAAPRWRYETEVQVLDQDRHDFEANMVTITATIHRRPVNPYGLRIG